MEKNLFREVYKQVCGLVLKDCPPSSLSGLLHGYLSVYSMVRVYPWLEDEYGSLWDIHDRIREIARVIQELLKDRDIPVDTRAGYVVDLMDAYLLYSDMKFLDVALDAAYEILIPKGSDKIVLPCRTPNICRLLCNCYYFTGEIDVAQLAIRLVTEALGQNGIFTSNEVLYWMKVLVLFENILDEIEIPSMKQEYFRNEYFRIKKRGERHENEKIEEFYSCEFKSLYSISDVFEILAKQKFVLYGEKYK